MKKQIQRLWQKFTDSQKKKRIELERDLDWYEEYLFDFIKLIFLREEINEAEIRAKLGLSKSKFNDLLEFSRSKGYIQSIIVSKPKSDLVYQATYEAREFLFNYKKLKEERRHSNWIKWATIALAVSAIVQMIDLLLNHPDTRAVILLKSTEGLSLFLVLFKWGLIGYLMAMFLKWLLYLWRKRKYQKGNDD